MITQAPAATIVTLALLLAVQTEGVLEVKLSAPVPEPPEVVGTKGAAPYVALEGPVIVSVAWFSRLIPRAKSPKALTPVACVVVEVRVPAV